MKELIDVFRMTEISAETRANIIVKLGDAINNQMAMNITQPIVYELVKILNPHHDVLRVDWFLKMAKVNPTAQSGDGKAET